MSDTTAFNDATVVAANSAMLVMTLALAVLIIVSMWLLFKKAGKPGWASVIPIYNSYIMTRLAGRPWWWLVLTFIPFVGIIFAILINIDFVRSYGKGLGYAVFALFLPFIAYPILALDKNVVYEGPAGPDKTPA